MFLPEPKCRIGVECVEIFNKYTGKDLADKINIKVADEWLYLYKPQFFNRKLPDIMIKYRSLTNERDREKFNRDNPDWITSEEMKKYAEEKRRVESENKRNRQFLAEIVSEVDEIRKGKVRTVLSLYGASS